MKLPALIRVLVVKECGYFVGIGMEKDVASQARTLPKLRESMARLLGVQLWMERAYHSTPIGPAPQDYQDAWTNGKHPHPEWGEVYARIRVRPIPYTSYRTPRRKVVR